jgi:lipoic acid synthetase
LPIVRYVHPDEFAEFKLLGEAMGFKHVEAGPLVRSSYHAFEQTESALA